MTLVRTACVLALLLVPGHRSGAQAIPSLFDVPWIGYDTGVYPVGLDPWASTVGDFNGDGVVDLATVSWGGTAYLSVIFADGAGGYLEPTHVDLLLESLGVVAGDLDGDGDLDLVVTDTGRIWEGATVSVYENDGAGGFTRTGLYSTGRGGPSGITIDDFDGDGWLDVAVAHDAYIVFGNTMAVLFNDGSGRFPTREVYVLDAGTRAIASGDLDGDSDADIIVGHETNKFTIMRNDGGALSVAAVVPGTFAGSIPELPQVHIADIDRDGDRDVFYSNADTGGFGSGAVGLWRNRGDGTLDVPEVLSFDWYTGGAVDLQTEDVTGDGWPDLLAVAGVYDNWHLLAGDGQGGFLAPRKLRAGSDPLSLQLPDLDGDGDRDVVIVASGSLAACVYLNPGDGSFVQPPVIDMTTPSIAPAFATNLQARDIDFDGDLDLVSGYRSDFSGAFGISVRRNRGDGSFAAIEDYPDTNYALVVRLGDLDGDTDLDLLWLDADNRLKRRFNVGDGTFGPISRLNSVFGAWFFDLYDVDNDQDLDAVMPGFFEAIVLMNDGGGTFGAPITTALEFSSTIGMGDFNADGNLDLLSNSGVQGYAAISNGNGDGTFQPANTVPTGRDVRAFATGDLDRDGSLDFAALYNLDESGLSIRRGRGNGQFHLLESFHGSYGAFDTESSLTLADVNDDGDLDALAANFGPQDFSYWQGHGDGSFARLVRYGVAEQAKDLAYGDFDGDGIGDVAALVHKDAGRYWYPGVVLLRGLSGDPRIALDLTQSELRAGQPATWTVSGAEPGETVFVVLTVAGAGPGPCFPILGGMCLDLLEPLKIVGEAVADADGVAQVTVSVPPGAPVGGLVASQALARRGPGGGDSVKSNVSTVVVLP